MELIETVVTATPSLTMPWSEVPIAPICDIQDGAPGADVPAFRRHIDKCLDMNAYYTFVGDLFDVASPTGRQKFRNAEFYDSVLRAMDEDARRRIDKMKRILEPTCGRWLVWSEGHHYWRFMHEDSPEYGRSTEEIMAEFVGCPVAAGAAITQLKFTSETGRRAIPCQIWQHHGTGSGATMTAPLNKLERMMSRFPTVDIFLIGHYTRKAAYPVDVLVPHFGKKSELRSKRRILAVCGSFYKGYEAGKAPSYVEKSMMPPTNIGGLIIYVRPVHSNSEDRLEMTVSL
jgi:hypothetical protein